ncbi:MAG: sulfate ABC transporter permease subunit CysT [Aestuariivirga sp.]|uniref:sulfate ABC transporter permease subunit CysT n=1 Tax=Aestuariivirga sp. TaxID=2650926 RepID=UPI0038D07DE3
MPAALLPRLRSPSVIPGFGLALGLTLSALSLIVLLPLAALVLRALSIGPQAFFEIATDPRTLAALRLSFGTALFAAAVNAVFGLLIAWVLVRYRFPGRRIIDAAVDLPFALPTAVAGIAMAAIYAPNGLIGSIAQALGFKIAYTPIGITIALIFIGLPFVVRTVQPVLEEVEQEIEEAAALLGASRARTVFQVVLPHVYPALLTGFALAFARGVGEYGSVIFIAGNIPMVSEIAPLLIVIKLEEFDYGGATVIATVMLAISFALLFLINVLQAWSRKKYGNV